MLHQVITTEKVPITYRVAGMGSRFLAWLADCGLIVVLGVMGAMAASVLDLGRPGLGTAVALLWVFTLKWGYFLFFEWLWAGQTPGKRAMGIRVIQEQGTAISFYQAAVRNVLRVADALPLFYGLAFVVAACNRHHRRLGDLAAGTLVVRERRAPLPAAQPAVPDFATADRYAAWDVSGVTAFELVTVRRFLERRSQLDPGARGRLGWELAERLRPKVAGAPPNLHPEQFLEALAEAKAARG